MSDGEDFFPVLDEFHPPLPGEAPAPNPRWAEFSLEIVSASPRGPEDDSEPDGEPSSHRRQRLIERFERWLDQMERGEPAPAGLPEELCARALEQVDSEDAAPESSDLYDLFAAMTAIKGEVGLQGRAFKQLSDALAPLAVIPQRLSQLESAQTLAARVLRELAPASGSLPSAKDALAVIMDLHERLVRGLRTFGDGLESIGERRQGWWSRRNGAARRVEAGVEAIEAMRGTYEMAISRIEAVMMQWGIERIGEPGEAFDPRRMMVVEVVERADVPDGQVLEVYRGGYSVNHEVLAAAQVKVARMSSAKPSEPE